jgi:hypothetical protein
MVPQTTFIILVDGYRLINRCNLVIEGVTDAVSKRADFNSALEIVT